MKVKIVTRFGEVKEFERKPKVLNFKAGERFETALIRCFYPAEYRRMVKEYGIEDRSN